jgi:hypothetical protein
VRTSGGWWGTSPSSEGLHRQLYPNNPSTTSRISKYQLTAPFSRHAAALQFHSQHIARAGGVAVVAWHARGRNRVAWSTTHPQLRRPLPKTSQPLTRSTTRRRCRTLGLQPRRPHCPSYRGARRFSSATPATTIASTSSSNYMRSIRTRTAAMTTGKRRRRDPEPQASMRSSPSTPAP